MAKDTSKDLRKEVMYSVYVRNHTEEGTFDGVTKDLDRIKDLGIDIIWLMPIHPIGQVNKKGSLGCPYSIEDYRKVNPEYGTLEDFKKLIEETHKRGMKLIIDVVYNHTSHKSQLLKEHPEWFYRKENGNLGNKVGDWTDIIDLDYNQKGLWQYQIETLKYWISLGVDGFRCDVGSLVPVEFWMEARKEVAKVRKNVIWLVESVEGNFIEYLRSNNVVAHSDCEMYEAFDIAYDYDTHNYLNGYLKGENDLQTLVEKKREQGYIYPDNYVKLRFLENHDQPRSAKMSPISTLHRNWTAFMFFQQGMPLIYAGQEAKDTKCPSLFEKDLINWEDKENFTEYLKKMIRIKKQDIFAYGDYKLSDVKKMGVIEARYTYEGKELIGIFNVDGKVGEYKLNIADGEYKNLIDEKTIVIKDGKFDLGLEPIIIKK